MLCHLGSLHAPYGAVLRLWLETAHLLMAADRGATHSIAGTSWTADPTLRTSGLTSPQAGARRGILPAYWSAVPAFAQWIEKLDENFEIPAKAELDDDSHVCLPGTSSD
jgi:hypothetical protein